MELNELRRSYLAYFQSLGYQAAEPSSLVPINDPTVLFTTAGMQQFKDYYQQPALSDHAKIVSAQPVIRTTDIEAVGDDSHLTMFEMLGNFRFGEGQSLKMKQGAIDEAWQFLTQTLQIEPGRLTVTYFAGEASYPADGESLGVWQSKGIEPKMAGRQDNFWGPTGSEGPCGPTTEIYLDGLEVWNLVFNQYYQATDGRLVVLKQAGLDTGAGLERLVATLQGKSSVWEIEPFDGWQGSVPLDQSARRQVVDHLRAIIFILSAGVKPGNKGRDYVLRRLMRRVVFQTKKIDRAIVGQLMTKIADFYRPHYQLAPDKDLAKDLAEEAQAFFGLLSKSWTQLEKFGSQLAEMDSKQTTELAFRMRETHGLPQEAAWEYLVAAGANPDLEYFHQLELEHQNKSRSGSIGQFRGGLADHQPQTIIHHTAHHLLLAALRQVLGPTVVQCGSNVTSERLRLDFNFERKLTDEELEKVERIVNEKIAADLPVVREEMAKVEALKSGALAEFGQKYGDTVAVYSIGDFSKELCGGPHVERTGGLGRFEILKEEASSRGVRRIKGRCLLPRPPLE
ncbi:MAG: alanine--tRNA ligase-related protein [Patescibacteria group bacterium]